MTQANQKQADVEVTPAILGGFFAGEGCIGIRKQSKKSKSPSLIVEVGNTEKVWIDILECRYGGYTRVYFPKRYHKSLPYYHWTIKDEAAANVLRDIYPFLIGEKRKQSEIGLALDAIKSTKPFRGRAGKAGHFKPDEISAMERLELELKELRRAVAETKRTSALSMRSDSPILQETVV